MSFIVLKNEKNQYELFKNDHRTEKFIGLMIIPHPPFENGRAFTDMYGPLHHRRELYNISDYPELASLDFFAIDYGNYA